MPTTVTTTTTTTAGTTVTETTTVSAADAPAVTPADAAAEAPKPTYGEVIASGVSLPLSPFLGAHRVGRRASRPGGARRGSLLSPRSHAVGGLMLPVKFCSFTSMKAPDLRMARYGALCHFSGAPRLVARPQEPPLTVSSSAAVLYRHGWIRARNTPS